MLYTQAFSSEMMLWKEMLEDQQFILIGKKTRAFCHTLLSIDGKCLSVYCLIVFLVMLVSICKRRLIMKHGLYYWKNITMSKSYWMRAFKWLTSTIAENLLVYPPEHVIYGDYAYEVWDEEMIKYLMDFFMPGNMRVDILTKSFKKSHGNVLYVCASTLHTSHLLQIVTFWIYQGKNVEIP